MKRSTTGAVHPITLCAIATLAVNDHWLKAWSADTSWVIVTGKLSDAAGVIVFPVLLAVLVRLPMRVGVAVTMAGFTVVKAVPAVGDAYGWVVGLLRMPVVGELAPIVVAHDPTDILVIPFALLALLTTASHRSGDPLCFRPPTLRSPEVA